MKAQNKINTKESFQCFYILVILIGSVYKKMKTIILKGFFLNIMYSGK